MLLRFSVCKNCSLHLKHPPLRMLFPSTLATTPPRGLSYLSSPVWSPWAPLHHSVPSHYTNCCFTCPSHSPFCVFSSLHPPSITECLAHTGGIINICYMSQCKNAWLCRRPAWGVAQGWGWDVTHSVRSGIGLHRLGHISRPGSFSEFSHRL